MGLAPSCNTTIAGATYRNLTEEIAVTVWYNNQVKKLYSISNLVFISVLIQFYLTKLKIFSKGIYRDSLSYSTS